MGRNKKLPSAIPPAIPNQVAPKNRFKKQRPTNQISVPKPKPNPLLVAICKTPYIPLLAPLVIKTMKFAYIQMHCFHLSLLGWHAFLCTKGKATATAQDIDAQVLLRVFKDENVKDPIGFLPTAMSDIDIQRVINIRNNTAHLNLNSIDQTGMNDLPALVLLNRCVSQHAVATEIKRVIDEMSAGNLDGLVTFSFTFTSAFSFEKAFGLSQIVYGVILEYLADALMTLLLSKLNLAIISIDVFANLKYVMDQVKTNADYLSPGGGTRGDAQVLQTVFDTRNDNAHNAFLRATTDWHLQLDSVHDILDVINHQEEAVEVKKIIDRLVELEAEGGTVTQEDFNFFE
ncbi:hypothetical protein DAPPUDRAFT_116382 [Daphnia pulex]|uniref:Uncharacterized protein n=1 Tax=Daphnia pulex TaxID=6669 RepID=E9HP78_DAPPU|nr:hypothetical protein DAPPUDRAFT_116382 [Daphnia pulex]|eukprot:EFX66462.1 hypothetical protein DAPPUDRAFT_116382 [Daphnia pulex]